MLMKYLFEKKNHMATKKSFKYSIGCNDNDNDNDNDVIRPLYIKLP